MVARTLIQWRALLKTLFAVVAVKDATALGAVIAKEYPTDHLLIADGQWLLADEGTAQSVSARLGITSVPPAPRLENPVSAALVLAVSGHYGLMVPNVWQWIRAKEGSA